MKNLPITLIKGLQPAEVSQIDPFTFEDDSFFLQQPFLSGVVPACSRERYLPSGIDDSMPWNIRVRRECVKCVSDLTRLPEQTTEFRDVSIGSHFAFGDLTNRIPNCLVVFVCPLPAIQLSHLWSTRTRMSVTEEFDSSRQSGHDDDGNNDKSKVVLDNRDVSKIKPTEDEKNNPSNSSDDIV
jgi:hypothetical protein